MSFSYRIYDKHSKQKCYCFYLQLFDKTVFKVGVNIVHQFFTEFYYTGFDERVIRDFADYLYSYHRDNNFFINGCQSDYFALIKVINEKFNVLLEIMRTIY